MRSALQAPFPITPIFMRFSLRRIGHTLCGMRLVIVFALTLSALAHAEEVDWKTPESTWVVGSLGAFRPQSSQAKGTGYAFNLGWERRLHSGVRFGLEVNAYGADYRTPPGISCGLLCSVDDSMSLSTLGFGGRVGYGRRLGAADVYAGAGLGWYFSMMRSTASVVGLPGEHTERDNNLGGDLRAGLAFPISERRALGVEVRRLWLSGSFGLLSSGQTLPLGGTALSLTFGQRF